MQPDGCCIQKAAKLLQQSQLVGIPTETVYGLAANALDAQAVEKIFIAKGRPSDNPLIVHIAEVEEMSRVASEVSDLALQLARAFWPGPLTLVLPKRDVLAPQVTAGLSTVGVRLPAHDVARQIIRAAGVPLAAPSANLSGSPSPTCAQHVYDDLCGKIPLIVDGGPSLVGLESTVLSLEGVPTILRPGFITQEDLEHVIGSPVALAPSIEAQLGQGEVPASPGMKYRHYAPQAEITIVNADLARYIQFLESEKQKDPGVVALSFQEEADSLPVPALCFGSVHDPASQAQKLFSALRQLDQINARHVYVRKPCDQGVGLAVRNRLLRAAAFREIEL